MRMMNIQTAIWIVFIIWNSISDIRKKQISLISCLAAVAGILPVLFVEPGFQNQFFARSLPGLVLLAVSFVTHGAVGAGDGLVILLTGWFLGASVTVEILFWGLFSSALFGIGMMLFRKAGRKTELSFVPFLLLGYCIRCGMQA